MSMTGRVSHQAIQEWYEAWNRRDWQEVAGFLAESFVLEDVALDRHYCGRQEYLDYARAWISAFPDARLHLTRISGGSEQGGLVVVEYSMTGTQMGAWG